MIRRDDRRDNGDGITEEAIDGLLNDEVHGQETNDRLGMGLKQTKTIKPFEERLEDLQSFKEKHGHVHVTVNHDKSLGQFCKNMRCARRGKGRRTMTITEDRVKALDELGFDWGDTTKASSVEERIEELKAFKEKHGHVHVTVKHDKSLGMFCKNMRSARRGTKKGAVITEDRIKALDELGFDWGGKTKNKSFEERIEELKVFKAKHGHVHVTLKHDKSLGRFCQNVRSARRGKGGRMAITDNRIKALDELGFDWGDKKA